MTVNIGNPVSFSDLKFRINTTVYTKAGDSITRKLNKVGLTPDTYARRHYVTSGEFVSDFPDTGLPQQTGGTVGTVWPLNGNVATDTFQITALEDNSSYVCIIPTDPNYQIVHEVHNLVSGQPYMTAVGKCYISTVDYTLFMGDQKKAGAVLVCATSPDIITPSASGSVMVFSAVLANDPNSLDT